jgi:hypothetical protein
MSLILRHFSFHLSTSKRVMRTPCQAMMRRFSPEFDTQSTIPKSRNPVFGKDHAQTKGQSRMPIQLNLIPLSASRGQ